jgi:MarR family transcriptional regulator, organic hydroperoxide resistance regulator
MDCRRGARLAGRASVADQAWALLLQIGFELVSAHFAAAAAELDLAPSQARALHELDLERPISMRELAERLKSDPSNVTGLIDRLETRGLVERRPHPSDRRIKGLALTAAGAKLRARLFERLYSAPPSVAALSERDQRVLRDVLQRIVSKPTRTADTTDLPCPKFSHTPEAPIDARTAT